MIYLVMLISETFNLLLERGDDGISYSSSSSQSSVPDSIELSRLALQDLPKSWSEE